MTFKAAITFDVERDCPGVADSHLGITKGLPRLLKILSESKISATFFITGSVAQKFPQLIQTLAAQHEIASHGFTHTTLDGQSSRHIIELRKSKQILEELSGQTVAGFRAPRLQITSRLFPALALAGYRYDSSQAMWLPHHRQLQLECTVVKEFPLLMPNVFLRFPGGLQVFQATLLRGKSPLTLYFHPSEAIPMIHPLRAAGVQTAGLLKRPDRWVNTGYPFLNRLRKLLRFLHKRRGLLAPLRDYLQ
ncbi:MAG: polysaccharide deacetylase family protein [Promethearchaeota archaeon]